MKALSFFSILQLVTTHICYVGLAFANPIRLTFVQYNDQSSNWTRGTSDSHPRVVLTNNNNVSFVCTAPYPIQWKVKGYIYPLQMVQLDVPERNLVDTLYTISAKVSNIDDYDGVGSASLRITCESIGNPKTKKDISFFVRGDNIDDSRVLVVTNRGDQNLTDSKLIPCLTLDPALEPTLYLWGLETEETEELNESTLRYQPAEGFKYTNGQLFDGYYTCSVRNAELNFSATTTNSSRYKISPVSNDVVEFTDSPIVLQCMQNPAINRSFSLSVNSTEHITTFSSQNSSGKVARVYVTQGFLDSKTVLTQTNATCLEGNSSDPSFVHNWHLRFMLTPVLQLNSYEGRAQCLTTLDARLQVLSCRNPIECQAMSGCLASTDFCSNRQEFSGRGEDICRSTSTNESMPCVQQNTLGFYGLIQCSVETLYRRLEYFVSLEYRRLSDWRKASINELLRMDPVPCVLYTNTTYQFTCVGLSWIATSLYFELVLTTGSVVLLQKKEDVSIQNFRSEHPRVIRDFNTLAQLDIVLPLEAVGIRCLAPWLNSTDILRTETKFVTRYLKPPRIPEATKAENIQETTKRETFIVGQDSKKLVCYADADPPPNYEWYFEGQNATEMFPELKITVGPKGESFLEFPAIMESSKNFTGEWKCIARNKAGKVEIKYKVDVRDDHFSQNTLAYVLTTGGILLVLLVAVIFVWRRYIKAKKLLRSLTETEVDDFFKGKPELVQKDGKQAGSDYVDFLPYNNDYEVPLKDMEFDSSEKNVLGSGFFSYVVRGRIISKEQPVAIKITKPTADVTLFKTLLSEVKIMLYIGEHQNVVSLVGVCTEGIRDRCIHIATHICDLGSLDHFLRKCRSKFVNLINENQEIDCSLLPVEQLEDNSATTLDLISFGYQIASGMEHLAYKSIIHADLAARNVLLTGRKVCKVSDFGLSKKLYESNTYVKKSKTPLPWRWMAIEALTTLTFSTSSDIWAYGVTLFEIFSLGDVPFPNETWSNDFVNRLTSGMRMGRPEYTTQDIYSKVMACWERNPEHRPPFSTLREYFKNLHENLQNRRPANIRQTYMANMDPCV